MDEEKDLPTVEKNKTVSFNKNQFIGGIVVAVVFIFASYIFGLKMGAKGYILQPKDFKVVNQSDAPKNVDYNLLWKAIDTVNQNFIDKPISADKFLYGAVKGAVEASGDQYTQFFTPKELEQFKTDLKGSFDGIGAEVGKQNDNIVIVAPLDGSPAKKAGLMAKDIVVKVNGESTSGWSVDEAVSKIRGQKGTEVTLTIYREGRTATFDVKIIRDKIEIKSVKYDYKEINGKKVAVITLSRFGDDSKELFNAAVNNILSSGAKYLVLDLRNDPGGYLETAVDIASNWVPDNKVIVTEAHSDPSKSEVYKSFGYNKLNGIKTVVLINGGSASAAEILSGALQDYGIAKLVGEKSFGKGSVQQLFDLPGNTAVKVTIAKWITPNGKNLNKNGLDPDIAIKNPENLEVGKDPQMDKALEEVTK